MTGLTLAERLRACARIRADNHALVELLLEAAAVLDNDELCSSPKVASVRPAVSVSEGANDG